MILINGGIGQFGSIGVLLKGDEESLIKLNISIFLNFIFN